MDINLLHPELRKPYSRIPPLPVHNRVFLSLIKFLMGKVIPNRIKPCPGVKIEDIPVNNCTVRVYQPEGKNSGAGLLWLHAGGYIIGNTGMNDKECSALAADLGLVVVSVDYRLAPRHPYPAALDDCFDAWQFMQSQVHQWDIASSRIAILGQSAGGGLAAAVVQRIADAGGIQPACQVLMYPMLDDRTAADTTLDGIKHRFWNNRNNRGAWNMYLQQAPGMAHVPVYAVAARREDLSGLPPAWVCAGELDLLFDEDRAYAERLKSAGVQCEFLTAPAAPHAYDAVAPDSSVASETVEGYYRFLRSQLAL